MPVRGHALARAVVSHAPHPLAPRLAQHIELGIAENNLLLLMAAAGLSEADYWWYLDLRRYGTVPHAGFGLGFERLIVYMMGLQNIRDAIPYPRVPGSATF